MKKYLFLIGIVLNLFYCSAGFDSREMVYLSGDQVFYKLRHTDFPDEELVKEGFNHPFTIDQNKLIDMLGNLKYTRKTMVGDFTEYVFGLPEVEKIARDLVRVLKNVNPKYGIFVLSKFEEEKSVLSQFKRTGFYIWVDKKGLNIVFGEIKKQLPKEVSSNFYEWTMVQPVPLTILSQADGLEIIEEDYFTFKEINGYLNRKWAILDLSNLEKYKLRERPRDTKSRSVSTETGPESDLVITKNKKKNNVILKDATDSSK